MSFIEAGDSLADVIDCLQDDLASFLSLKTIRPTTRISQQEEVHNYMCTFQMLAAIM